MGVSRVWVGLSRLGAQPLLRRRRVAPLKSYRDQIYDVKQLRERAILVISGYSGISCA